LDVNGNINTSGGLCIQGDCKGAWSQVGGQWANGLGGTIYYLGGNVGIGTNTGSQKLAVQGMLGLYPQAYVAPIQRGLFMFHGGTGGSIYAFNHPSGTADPISIAASTLDFNTYIGSTPNTRLSIANGGNIGIGTSTPTRKLEVLATDGEALRLYRNAANAGFGVNLKFAFNNSSGAEVDYAGLHGISASTTAGAEAGDLIFTTVTGGSLTEKMRVSSIGSVGIGTTTPNSAYKLDISGSMNASGGLCLAGDCKTAWSQVGGASQWITGGSNISFNTGNVGIGTTGPGDIVHVRKDQNASTQLLVENATAGASAQADVQLKNNLGHIAQFGVYSSTTTPAGALASGNAYSYTTSPAMVMMANNPVGVIKFATGGVNERMRIDASGNVGVGTTTPSDPMQVDSASGWGVRIRYTGDGQYLRLSSNQISSFTSAGAGRDLYLNPAGGNVGIGTATPTAKIHVAGDGKFTGNLVVDGNIAAKYQDVAEWVESSQSLSAGTVVVLDHTRTNQVVASAKAYDTRVAGVISAQPGITLGESGDAKVLVATTGRVRVKVDATSAPIQVGDLLVTGDREGFAMKSLPVNIAGVQLHRPGTLVGKALEPLAKGTGEILVLLSLQ
jgi:hypothetical protein